MSHVTITSRGDIITALWNEGVELVGVATQYDSLMGLLLQHQIHMTLTLAQDCTHKQ